MARRRRGGTYPTCPEELATAFAVAHPGSIAVEVGITGREPPDLIKPLRLCNTVSVVAFAIMMTWALFEIGAGNLGNLQWELGLALGFATCLS